MSPHHWIILKQKSRIMDARSSLGMLFFTAYYLCFFIEPTSAASCDNKPHELNYSVWDPPPNDWKLDAAECPTRNKYLQVGDADPEDPLDSLVARLEYPVDGFSFQQRSLKLNCNESKIVERGLRRYTLYVIVQDGCPSHSLNFSMNVEFTDIDAVSNQHDPRLRASKNPFDVVRDLFETDGETDVVTLYCSDDDNDQITSVNITNQVSPFSVISTQTPTTFTLRLIGNLGFVASPLTLTLEVVDGGIPPRTGTTVLIVNINEDAPTTTTSTTTTSTTSTITTPTTTTTTLTVTTSSQPDNSTEGPTRVDEQGGQGEIMKMVGWGVGLVLAVMFVLTIALVYARKRNMENDYHSIVHASSTCSGSTNLASDYTNAGIAPSDSGTQGVSNGTVVPSSQADDMVPRSKYQTQRIYDNYRYSRPSHRMY